MLLIAKELAPSVYQVLRPTKNTIVGAVRPHLYIHNLPAGSIKVQICESDGTVLAESSPVAISSITSANEFHGYVTFNVSANLQKNVTYQFKIVGTSGYSFSESAYVAVCQDYDLRKYALENPVRSGWFSPLDLEIWSLSKK